MDDLTLIKACAEAMGLEHRVVDGTYVECKPHPADPRWWVEYRPLHDDAQAMALVKRFNLERRRVTAGWLVEEWRDIGHVVASGSDPDLNRAICLAVAQRGKE